MAGQNQILTYNELEQWTPAFLVDDRKPGENHHLVNILAVSVRDIYSSKLKKTRNIFKSIDGGDVVSLFPECRNISFLDAAHLLAVIATHNRLARSSFSRMRSPGRWVKARDLYERPTYRPCFPISQIIQITGMGETPVKHILSTLAEDGALRSGALRGVPMVQLVDGYVRDTDIGRHLEI